MHNAVAKLAACEEFAADRLKSCLKELFGHVDQLKVAKFVAACLAKRDSMFAKC